MAAPGHLSEGTMRAITNTLKSEIAASVENLGVGVGGVLVYDVGAKQFMVEVKLFDVTGAEEQA